MYMTLAKMKRVLLVLLTLMCLPQLAHAWWNKDWASRAKVTLDAGATGVDVKEGLDNVPLLVRLHSGNFNFIGAREDGSDLRFVGADDKTPLKFHVEKFDALAEIALVWVQVPKLAANTKDQHIWVYYGNDTAPAAGDAHGSYDVNQIAVFQFNEKDGAPQDATAYGNNSTQFSATRIPGGAIGQGAAFNGSALLSAPASPSLKLTPASGFTFSAWIKIDAPQEAQLFGMQDGHKALLIQIKGTRLYVHLQDGGAPVDSAGAELQQGSWQHVAVTVSQEIAVYVNGQLAGKTAGIVPDMQGGFSIGKDYKGEIDEVELSNIARTPAWIEVAAKSQGPESKLGALDKEEANERAAAHPTSA